MASKTKIACIAEEWLDEDHLMLLECWSRDGYTLGDIANKIGIGNATLTGWKNAYPEIAEALRKGREIIDYKVENALLKSALGYHTKEVKVTTTMRYGKVVETIKEVLDKEQAPNVSAIQCWLFNRCRDKWKKNPGEGLLIDEEDARIQVTVTRASKSEAAQSSSEDEEWEDEVNQSIEIRKATEEEMAEKKKAKKEEQKGKAKDLTTKVEAEEEDDPDYWPEDWEDEDWEDEDN